jgi:bacteriocin-like protein
MRQLSTTELETISGGNEVLAFMGIVGLTALTIGLIASIPTRPCSQVITPVFDPYTGVYMGDMVDTYCY